MATAAWLVAGVVSTGGVSALTVAKFWNSKVREREQGGSNDEQ